MDKDYDAWNGRKKQISLGRDRKVFFAEGDIWWCTFGINVGAETDGKGDWFRRPVVVLKKFAGELCFVIPLSTRQKRGTWFCEVSVLGETRFAFLHQVRTVSALRFQRKIGVLAPGELVHVKRQLKRLLGLS